MVLIQLFLFNYRLEYIYCQQRLDWYFKLTPQPPALRDGIAKGLAKPRPSDAYLFEKERGMLFYPFSLGREGVGDELKMVLQTHPQPLSLGKRGEIA